MTARHHFGILGLSFPDFPPEDQKEGSLMLFNKKSIPREILQYPILWDDNSRTNFKKGDILVYCPRHETLQVHRPYEEDDVCCKTRELKIGQESQEARINWAISGDPYKVFSLVTIATGFRLELLEGSVEDSANELNVYRLV
ncbi:MAG TPA: hypothetical protein PL066_03140 [bacterium]|nr:hypothetical protein [bacterium]